MTNNTSTDGIASITNPCDSIPMFIAFEMYQAGMMDYLDNYNRFMSGVFSMMTFGTTPIRSASK